MKRLLPVCWSLAAMTFLTGCHDEPVAPDLVPTEAAAKQILPEIINVERTLLQDGIAHYTFDLDLGPDEFDVVRLHRIVKERRADQPERTVDAVFLLPGYPNSWLQIFVEPMISGAVAWDHSVAIFLAQNDIDVWGIDYAWALVPREESNFEFMAGWGMQKDVSLAHEALLVARALRLSTGQGNGRLHVLGFSYGVPVAYGLVGLETLQPPGQRVAKGLIAVENEVKYEDPVRRAAACANARTRQDRIDAGTYHGSDGVFLATVGALAESNPDGTSPFAPFLTNYQFSLFVGTTGSWHFVGGYFDEAGIPTGLRFTESALWLDLLQAGPSYTPLQASVDARWAQCDGDVDVEFDDHLAEIALPILAVNAAGGIGGGAYDASLTSTGDFQELMIQLLPGGEEAYDFGHADLFTADMAPELVWRPILNWLMAHRENRIYP